MMTDIEWLLLPPIMLNQFHLWQDTSAQGEGRPHGFASWAYFGEEQEERIANKGIRRLMGDYALDNTMIAACWVPPTEADNYFLPAGFLRAVLALATFLGAVASLGFTWRT